MVRDAHELGTDNLLAVPGAVHIPWRPDHESVPNDVCDRRAREAVAKLIPLADEMAVSLNIENIFFNGYLMTPEELNAFIDHFGTDRVRAHFDTGNIALFQFPEHWDPILGRRIMNIHFREFSKTGTDRSLESFTLPLYGTTNWPAVMEAHDKAGYKGYVTWELFHPAPHYPKTPIYYISDALERMLGRMN
jgi:hexulose-6-phosphate isomerase